MLSASPQSAETQKGKKGLPFLKNPMSTLLMRRKASQNVPDIRPLPLSQKPAEPSYDPRIRGTRVHDFSAPRPRRTLTGDIKSPSPVLTRADTAIGISQSQIPPQQQEIVQGSQRTKTGRSSSLVSETTLSGTLDAETQRRVDLSDAPSGQGPSMSRHISLDDKPLPAETATAAPNEDDVAASSRSISTKSQTISADQIAAIAKSNPSTRTVGSHRISLSEGSVKDGHVSALPKHMKSTSSRFSFDMIGAARAEKLLEERHRQKELEKLTADPSPTHRDSRFDDFDEDAFDYDAMMEDDGLEESIPEVGFDYEQDDDGYLEEELGVQDEHYDEDDPDNDQENFAGFVFQRSDPQSAAPSPNPLAMLNTPRDVDGKAIGFAVTKDQTPDLRSAPSPLQNNMDLTPEEPKEADNVAGLGIQGLDAPQKTRYDPTVFQERRNKPIDDGSTSANPDRELYFDEGLLEELALEADEIQQSTFDESIFDDNDTDEYGRPIPGAFAQAQAMRTTLPDQDLDQELSPEMDKRESEITSHQSVVSPSTAHTSVSLALHRFPSVTEKARDKSVSPNEEYAPVVSPSQLTSDDKVAAYQAALAQAAYEAAASGKFRRDSSPLPPLPPADVTITSPTTAGSQPSSGGQNIDPAFNADDYENDDYGDDYGGDAFDDFDFDDEAIIAEANAEALAYDSDGFYGQEFGFYSAPVSGGHPPSSSGPSNNNSNGVALSKQNLFEYSNGGYFGPSGAVNRTISGRVVSREPNLTPITERSEYSNRNSIMSLLPGTFSDGRNSAALHSPGLAQMIMMADDSDMNLSSLLRLRSKAWGGSQVSLNSSREGSPRSELAPPNERVDGPMSPAAWDRATHLSVGGFHTRKNSNFSIRSNSDAGSGSGSPTMHFSMPNSMSATNTTGVNDIPPQPLFSPPPVPKMLPMALPSPGSQCPPVLEDEEMQEENADESTPLASPENQVMFSPGLWTKDTNHIDINVVSPVSPFLPVPPAPTQSPPEPPADTPASSPISRSGKSHRHKTSADSISYIKEEESGETRWVMERRRTADSGEVEILGREVLKGGI